MPEVWVSRCLRVMPCQAEGASGRYLESKSSTEILRSSASIMSAVAVKLFVMEAIPYTVSFVAGTVRSMFARP